MYKSMILNLIKCGVSLEILCLLKKICWRFPENNIIFNLKVKIELQMVLFSKLYMLTLINEI